MWGGPKSGANSSIICSKIQTIPKIYNFESIIIGKNNNLRHRHYKISSEIETYKLKTINVEEQNPI